MFKKILLGGVAGGAGLYASAVAYCKYTTGKCYSDRDLQGRTVIVTGGNTGIGLETARDLAARNARVILACRSLSKGQEAAKQIIESTGNTNVIVKHVDVSSFQSVRAFAKDIIENEKRLDVLVNNAGILNNPSKEKSEDGIDLVMATNHFGPFLLTNLLLPLLKESAPSRVVVVSSIAYKWGRIERLLGDKESCKKGRSNYGASKLANVLFTRELSERLKDTAVTANALHPGAVKTELDRNMSKPSKTAIQIVLAPFFKTPVEGAQTSIYLAVAEELEGVSGKYFSDCKEETPEKRALDESAAKKLWEYSERVTKMKE